MGDRWILACVLFGIYVLCMICGWVAVKKYKMAPPRELKIVTWLYPVFFALWVVATILISTYR